MTLEPLDVEGLIEESLEVLTLGEKIIMSLCYNMLMALLLLNNCLKRFESNEITALFLGIFHV